jgi:hypothetical protein
VAGNRDPLLNAKGQKQDSADQAGIGGQVKVKSGEAVFFMVPTKPLKLAR